MPAPGTNGAKAGPVKEKRLIGYARVSTDEQNLRLQIDALRAAGCARIFRDKGVSGKAAERPGLGRALSTLRPGDVLVVWRLDRLGRSLHHLIELVHELSAAERGFLSLSETIDTNSASGRLAVPLKKALERLTAKRRKAVEKRADALRAEQVAVRDLPKSQCPKSGRTQRST